MLAINTKTPEEESQTSLATGGLVTQVSRVLSFKREN